MKKSDFLIYFAIALAVVVISLPFIPKRANSTVAIKHEIKNNTASFPININEADMASLEKLPGIGPSIASRIIDYRNKHVFKFKKDIMKVSGIGEKTYGKIENLITTGKSEPSEKDSQEETRVNINTAGLEELISLPGIGKVYAERIIEYRRKHRFESIGEIVKIKGIGEKTYQKLKDLIRVK